ncbi:MAG: TIGR01244 family sulfur transferase [Halioglobus sp.]|nr:TIGR01244 family sulfur transferase [Halioglobus sp.]
MNIVELSDNFAVSAQIAPRDMADIAAAGYKVVVNNRPDGEESGQPSGAEIAAAAEQAGLEYRYMPINHMDFPGPDLEAFAELLEDSDSAVFAYCRSGTRCANLWVASRPPDARERAAATAHALGYDLGMASRYLARAD